jgi:hypothetical protein
MARDGPEAKAVRVGQCFAQVITVQVRRKDPVSFRLKFTEGACRWSGC